VWLDGVWWCWYVCIEAANNVKKKKSASINGDVWVVGVGLGNGGSITTTMV